MQFRYQNQNFKHKLDSARHYKRNARKIPQTSKEIFFAKIGLETWPSKLALVFVLGLLSYLTYIPNFLYIKNIEVNGLKIEEREKVLGQIQTFLKKRSLFPQTNILLLNKTALKNSLEKNNLFIKEISSIEKDLPASITLNINPRYAKYVSQSGPFSYQISSDGIITSLDPMPEKNNLTQINFSQTGDWVIGQKVLSEDQTSLLNKISSNLVEVSNQKVKNFQIDFKNEQDLIVETQQNYSIKFDVKTTWEESLNSLSTLFTKISPGETLGYIDLRVPERAYVCYRNTACANQKQTQVAGTATSTPIENPIKN